METWGHKINGVTKNGNYIQNWGGMQSTECSWSAVWVHWPEVLCNPQMGGPRGPSQLALNYCVIHYGSEKITGKCQALW